LELGRRGAVNAYSGDLSAGPDIWSYFGDLLCTMSLEGGRPAGGHMYGHMLGGVPDGASLRLLSMVGHGLKSIDVYTWGPWHLFSDGWSENLAVYAPIARAMGRLARVERVVYPGKPERGSVTVCVPH